MSFLVILQKQIKSKLDLYLANDINLFSGKCCKNVLNQTALHWHILKDMAILSFAKFGELLC